MIAIKIAVAEPPGASRIGRHHVRITVPEALHFLGRRLFAAKM